MSDAIDLYFGLAFYVQEDARGKRYTNQAGGYACKHPEITGYIYDCGDSYNLVDRLIAYFTGPKWGGWCCDGVDEETAEWMDEQLAPHNLTVDRERMRDSMEAWVYVKCTSNGTRGVFAWENSD